MLTIPGIDRELLRMWRLMEDLAGRVRRVRVLHARHAPRGNLREATQHHIPTLVACLEGVVRIETAPGPIDLAPGEVLIIAPGAWHGHADLRPQCSCYGQGLTPQASDVILMGPAQTWLTLLPSEPSRSLLLRLVAEPDQAEACRLAADLASQSLSGTATSIAVTRAQNRMAGFIWHHLHRPITAAQVLAASGLGERQAHRQFVAYFGDTPKRILLRFRLDLARQRLDEGASVAEAAEACGFTGRADLTRAWRRAFGAPPSARTPGATTG